MNFTVPRNCLRKPASTLSPTARAEVDYLLARLAAKDPRAADFGL